MYVSGALQTGGGGAARGEYSAASLALVAGVLLSSVGLLLLTANPLLALLPLAFTVVAYAAWALPIRFAFYPIVALVILADIVPRDPANGLAQWTSPVAPLQLLLLDNLNKLVGVEALKFSGTEVLLLSMLVLCALRALAGTSRDVAGGFPTVAPLRVALALSLVAVIALEFWGAARGGDVRQSLWQFRQLAWLPIIAAIASYALRGAEDFITLIRAATLAAALKVAVGIYYFRLVVHSGGERPQTVTSHHDTVLFVVVIAIWIATYLHRRTRRQLYATALVCSWMLLGMILNNRRTAYVSLVAVLITFFALQPIRVRRAGYARVARFIPFVVAYLIGGQYSNSWIFTPAKSLVSVSSGDDASKATRDIENYNLILTLKQHLLTGSGWGHRYSESQVAYDISGAFEQYRYIAHNSVLWLWSIGGLAGFTALWLFVGVGIFFASRSYYVAATAQHRTAAYGAVAIYTAFIVQAWSDMGTQSWTICFLVACATAVSGKLAMATGAWPSTLRAFVRVSVPHAREG